MNVKIFSNAKMLALIAIIVVALSGSAFMLQDSYNVEIIEYDAVKRAVIIDQLSYDVPNPQFSIKAADMLQKAGYEVDIITHESITVDFYKELPSMNYNYIVVRSHATDDNKQSSVALFTGERYVEDKYISEQLFGQVVKGAPVLRTLFHQGTDSSDWNVINGTYREVTSPFFTETQEVDPYFLITPKLVDDAMVGKFPDSIFVIGGCDSLSNTSLAESLVNRGASTIVGWDETIDSGTNDDVMLLFLENSLINNMKIDDAIDSALDSYDWRLTPFKESRLTHFPK